ncbi:hypothetical protein T439DRAFT_360517 [Meredithblackwellia eburnea MCA 4105]
MHFFSSTFIALALVATIVAGQGSEGVHDQIKQADSHQIEARAKKFATVKAIPAATGGFKAFSGSIKGGGSPGRNPTKAKSN